MTQQYTGGNNVMISMLDGGSVPIVSQTGIDPMKIALSLMFALVTTTALTEPLPVPKPPGPGGSCPHDYIASGSFSARRRRVLRTPSRSRATARVRGDRARAACEIDARGRSLRARFRFLCRGSTRSFAPFRRLCPAHLVLGLRKIASNDSKRC